MPCTVRPTCSPWGPCEHKLFASRQIVETSRVGWVNSLSRQAWSSIVIKLQLWLTLHCLSNKLLSVLIIELSLWYHFKQRFHFEKDVVKNISELGYLFAWSSLAAIHKCSTYISASFDYFVVWVNGQFVFLSAVLVLSIKIYQSKFSPALRVALLCSDRMAVTLTHSQQEQEVHLSYWRRCDRCHYSTEVIVISLIYCMSTFQMWYYCD